MAVQTYHNIVHCVSSESKWRHSNSDITDLQEFMQAGVQVPGWYNHLGARTYVENTQLVRLFAISQLLFCSLWPTDPPVSIDTSRVAIIMKDSREKIKIYASNKVVSNVVLCTLCLVMIGDDGCDGRPAAEGPAWVWGSSMTPNVDPLLQTRILLPMSYLDVSKWEHSFYGAVIYRLCPVD
jgi:hypothetical protein